MKNILIAAVAIVATLFVGCKDEESYQFKINESIKQNAGFKVGSQWVYDVSVNKTFELTTKVFYTDTLYIGRVIPLTTNNAYVIINKGGSDVYYTKDNIKYYSIKKDVLIKDSIFLFGEYRDTSILVSIVDSVRIYLADLVKLDYEGNKMVMKGFVTARVTIGPLNYTDTITCTEFTTKNDTFMMSGNTTIEQTMRNVYKSSLNKNETVYDVIRATSTGFNYFNREVKTLSNLFKPYEFVYTKGVLDTTAFSNKNNNVESLLINQTKMGATDVNVIKSKVFTTNNSNIQVIKNFEYWVSPTKGMLYLDDKYEATTWTLKNSSNVTK